MRQALVSLIAVAAVATPAFAQDAGATTVETTTTVTTSSTTVPAPAPAVVAPPPPALPPIPNDPTTLQVISALDRVCKPVIAGGDVVAITKPLGFRKKRETYVLALQKPGSITLTRSAANPNVCNLEVIHPLGGDRDITVGLHNWAVSQGFTLYRNDEFTTDLKRHTRSWERTLDGKTEALVLVTEHKPDGTGVVRGGTRSRVMYTVQ
ncbi:MAG TPA: hypothetical protein VD906_16460 [Caulobacteraceae bacterium]|nr:hypothetical protein [Caulobacteraceae bacterium]